MGAGLGGLSGMAAAAPPPPLSSDVQTLRHAWRWCGGWVPERLPLYLALHPFDDPQLLMDLLQHLQQRLNKRLTKDLAA